MPFTKFPNETITSSISGYCSIGSMEVFGETSFNFSNCSLSSKSSPNLLLKKPDTESFIIASGRFRILRDNREYNSCNLCTLLVNSLIKFIDFLLHGSGLRYSSCFGNFPSSTSKNIGKLSTSDKKGVTYSL